MVTRIFAISVLLLLSTTLQIYICDASSSGSQQFRSNPYDILQVNKSCTQKDIQQQYRKLCLLHHPDKKRTIDSEEAKDEDEDHEFKELQHAYSLIGTREDRRKHDLMRKFNVNNNANAGFNAYDTSNMFGSQHTGMPDSSSSNMYFTFGGRTYAFQTGGRGSRQNYPFQRMHRDMSQSEQHAKPHYVQKVTVPLDKLYDGGGDVELELKTSMFERYKAAFNGGILKKVLLQSASTVILTWLRSQKVHWLLSLFLFISMVHIHLPPPPIKVSYPTTIQKGWKGGTKLNYNSPDADITFIIQEGNHDAYTRVGNDLHTQVEVTRRQLRKGCTLIIDSCGDTDEPIKVILKPHQVKDGDIITVKSCGWPQSGGKEFGDVKVKIRCRVPKKARQQT